MKDVQVTQGCSSFLLIAACKSRESAFISLFQNCKLVLGNVIALMEPWRAPKYCQRAWCVFELHAASEQPALWLRDVPPVDVVAVDRASFCLIASLHTASLAHSRPCGATLRTAVWRSLCLPQRLANRF